MASPELRTVLVLSTSHVDAATRDWLNSQGEIAGTFFEHNGKNGSPGVHMGAHVYGWTVYAHEGGEWHDKEVSEGIKAVLDPIFTYAAKHKAYLIHFDCDASENEDLPTFEW